MVQILSFSDFSDENEKLARIKLRKNYNYLVLLINWKLYSRELSIFICNTCKKLKIKSIQEQHKFEQRKMLL